MEDDSAAGLSVGDAGEPGALATRTTRHTSGRSRSRTGPTCGSRPSARRPPCTGPSPPAASWARAGRAGCCSRCSWACSPATTARAEVAHASTTYAARRAHVVDALAARGVAVPGTEGINIWVPVQDETAAVVRLASRGIGVAAGAPFRVGPPTAMRRGHVRVTVGAPPEDLDAARGRAGRRRTGRRAPGSRPLSPTLRTGSEPAGPPGPGRHEGRAAGLPGLRPAALKRTSHSPIAER